MSAAEHVRIWLARRLTGCDFAGWLAGSAGRILFSVFPGIATAEAFDAFLDLAANQHLPAIGVLPAIRGEKQLVEQLRALLSGTRWKASIEHPAELQTDDTLVGLSWRTPSDLWSSPMGLAPFPTMPVSRRAPHVCIAAWPGGHENPYWTRYKPDRVDFLDTRIDAATVSRARYRRRWERSVAETTMMLSDPPDSASHYRTVAFRLSAATKAAVEAVVAADSA